VIGSIAVREVDEAVARVSPTDGVNGYMDLFYMIEAIGGEQFLHVVGFDRVREVTYTQQSALSKRSSIEGRVEPRYMRAARASGWLCWACSMAGSLCGQGFMLPLKMSSHSATGYFEQLS
jgi:hypothetical protein